MQNSSIFYSMTVKKNRKKEVHCVMNNSPNSVVEMQKIDSIVDASFQSLSEEN